jgi:hypothetical protein
VPPAIDTDTIQRLGALLAFGIKPVHESPPEMLVGVLFDVLDARCHNYVPTRPKMYGVAWSLWRSHSMDLANKGQTLAWLFTLSRDPHWFVQTHTVCVLMSLYLYSFFRKPFN